MYIGYANGNAFCLCKYKYKLRVLHGEAKDSSFSGPKSHGSALLLCCTRGADAAAQLHVQMTNQESTQGSGNKQQSCQTLFYNVPKIA